MCYLLPCSRRGLNCAHFAPLDHASPATGTMDFLNMLEREYEGKTQEATGAATPAAPLHLMVQVRSLGARVHLEQSQRARCTTALAWRKLRASAVVVSVVHRWCRRHGALGHRRCTVWCVRASSGKPRRRRTSRRPASSPMRVRPAAAAAGRCRAAALVRFMGRWAQARLPRSWLCVTSERLCPCVRASVWPYVLRCSLDVGARQPPHQAVPPRA